MFKTEHLLLFVRHKAAVQALLPNIENLPVGQLASWTMCVCVYACVCSLCSLLQWLEFFLLHSAFSIVMSNEIPCLQLRLSLTNFLLNGMHSVKDSLLVEEPALRSQVSFPVAVIHRSDTTSADALSLARAYPLARAFVTSLHTYAACGR